MTGPDQAPEPAPRPRRSRPPGPELIGILLAVVVLAMIGTTAFAGPTAPPAASGSARPTSSAGPVAVSPSPLVDAAVVKLLRAVNERLAGFGVGLQRELDRSTLRTNEVASLVRQVNTTVTLGADAVTALDGALGENEPGGMLAALYKSIGDSATQTLGASLTNDADYRVGAGVLVKFIAQIGPLQEALDALALGPPSSPGASSGSVPPSAPASSPPPPQSAPPPSSAPPASATPGPSVGSPVPPPSGGPVPPEPSPAPDEQVRNGGFEAGVGTPWGLFLGQGGQASLAADTSAPAAGTTAARVDIAVGSAAYSGISLRQPGLRIEAGRQYTLTLWVRAEAAREIRVRVASTAGASYLARTAPASPIWSPVTFPFIAPATDASAVLEIDLGRSDVTTWIDSVSFRPTTTVP